MKRQGVSLLLLSNAQTCFIYNELPEEIRNLFDEVLISEIGKKDEKIQTPYQIPLFDPYSKLGYQGLAEVIRTISL